VSRVLKLMILVGLTAAAGCGGVAQRDTTQVDVTATVTGPDGRPLAKTHVIILQPAGDTQGAKLEAKSDGTFSGKATPGRYVYYVKTAGTDVPPKGMAAKFSEPNADNTVEVAAGKPLDIKLSN
jgi:hypothetical protein